MDFLNILKYALIGFIQGLTEPLPVSSSAHMILFSDLLNINNNDINFEIIINFASTLAIMIVFRKKIFALTKNILSKKQNTKYPYLNKEYFFKLIIASVPSVIIGLLFKDIIDKFFTNPIFVSCALLITSIMLFITFILANNKNKVKNDISYLDSITIGITQSFALTPGISRSGSIFFCSSTRNIFLKSAFDFSFFLYLIVSVGALVFSLKDITAINIRFEIIVITFIVTFLTTLFSIKAFSKILSNKTFLMFSIYTFIVGITFLLVNIF